LSCAQGGQDALDVGDGGEHLAGLDFGNLALGDTGPSGQAFAGEAGGISGLTQGGGQLVLTCPKFVGFEDGNGSSLVVVGERYG
jgi:hypothetical protein